MKSMPPFTHPLPLSAGDSRVDILSSVAHFCFLVLSKVIGRITLKTLFILHFTFYFIHSATACDLCGCSNGGAYFGIMPQVGRQFVGVRYRTSSFDSHLNSMLRTREQFQSAELWGRFYPIKRLQVLAFVPYFFNQQNEVNTGRQVSLQGLSDITALASYNVFNTFWDSTYTGRMNHSLLLGGGIKLPTGRYKYDIGDLSNVANPNFQLGTGSTDFLLTVLYSMRLGNWGWNTDFVYKLNTTNSNQYRFGNRLTTSSLVFYVKEIGNLTLMPNAGLYAEIAAQDQHRGTHNNRTGGSLTMVNAGLEVFLKRLTIGSTYQHPIFQNLANREVHADARATVHLTVMF
jgi:hypothetical protein